MTSKRLIFKTDGASCVGLQTSANHRTRFPPPPRPPAVAIIAVASTRHPASTLPPPRYANIRDAIASHRADESTESDTVTLVLERAVNASAWREPPRGARATLEPLQDVIFRDLQKGAVAGVEKELDKLSVPERVGRLLSPDDDIFKR